MSVTRRRSPTGFEQSPALVAWTGCVLTLRDSGGDGAVVKVVASGRSSRWISEQRGLVLDANGAISGREDFRGEVGGRGRDSLGGSDDVGGGCTHCVSP